MAQMVKSIPGKHEELSLDLKSHVNLAPLYAAAVLALRE